MIYNVVLSKEIRSTTPIINLISFQDKVVGITSNGILVERIPNDYIWMWRRIDIAPLNCIWIDKSQDDKSMWVQTKTFHGYYMTFEDDHWIISKAQVTKGIRRFGPTKYNWIEYGKIVLDFSGRTYGTSDIIFSSNYIVSLNNDIDVVRYYSELITAKNM